MVDHVRAHERVAQRVLTGERQVVGNLLPKPVDVLITAQARTASDVDLVIHFHGSSWLPMQAAEDAGRALVMAVVNVGAGGGAYEHAFEDAGAFPNLLREIESASKIEFRRVHLTAFSAGYGAVRAILRNHYDSIDGVLLLDGLHTSYFPERMPVAEGGKLDVEKIEPFRRLAGDSAQGRKRFIVTHSEIFPGTFASTTETADHLLQSLDLSRRPVLKWGPLGMQQVGEAERGAFRVLSFAGNTAPDHVDHLHALATFLPMLLQ